MSTGQGLRGASPVRGFRGRGLLIGCIALAATVSAGCHHDDHPGGIIGVGNDGGEDAGDNQDAAIGGDGDASTDTGGPDAPPADQRPGDQADAADASVIDAAGADAGDAGPPACAGLGKVEDPLGCSGAHICDGAGHCVSRYTVFPITRLTPSTASHLSRITTGPDGNLWFIDGDAVGTMTPTGDSHELAMPGSLDDIASGPDGNLWFTDGTNRVVGRVTTAGTPVEFPRVAGRPISPYGIVAGPDGNLWFADLDGIGKMTTAGALTMLTVPTAVPYATWIAVGSDGNFWFTEQVGKIGRITPAGAITEFPLPETPLTPTSSLAFGIVAGPDGNLWFAEPEPNKIGRITPVGVVTSFPVPTPDSLPSHVAAGPDGNVWFVESFGNQVGRITPSGTITEFVPPTADAVVVAIARGPDDALWFTEDGPADVGTGEPHLGWLVRMQP